MRLEAYSSIKDLTESAAELVNQYAADNIFFSSDWFALFETHVGCTLGEVQYAVLYDGDIAVTVLPLLLEKKALGYVKVGSLTNYYSPYYSIFTRGEYDRDALIRETVGRYLEKVGHWTAIDLYPILETDMLTSSLRDKFRYNSYLYYKYHNWVVNVGDYESYFAARPSRLKNTLKRKRKKLQKDPQFKIEYVQNGELNDKYIGDFFAVYAHSWKKQEPYERFLTAFFKQANEKGLLRMGVIYHQDRPVAVQVWFVDKHSAKIFKLAYDEEYSEFSVGTLLTDHIIRSVIENDKVTMIDYLTGNDNYKKEWMTHSRKLLGVVVLNTHSLMGLLMLSKSTLGRVFKYINKAFTS